MTIVKKTAEFTIFKRRDGRYSVKDNKGKAVNGDEKVTVLQAEGFLKAPEAKPVEDVAETEDTGEESATEE